LGGINVRAQFFAGGATIESSNGVELRLVR